MKTVAKGARFDEMDMRERGLQSFIGGGLAAGTLSRRGPLRISWRLAGLDSCSLFFSKSGSLRLDCSLTF